jgi:hypothetical protein
VLAETFGEAEARHLGGTTGRLIGLQYYAETGGLLGIAPGGAPGFARYLTAIARAQDDRAEWDGDGEEVVVRQQGWRLMKGVWPLPSSAFDAWNALWEGALSIHDRRLALLVTRRLDHGDPCIEWRLRQRGSPGR